ncbi:GatB/YqeY domain-containing protein, partial [Desulfobacterales bacterium HSG16]|nr:GatB/YqeY domain-containing protein [Desulfobacterales bacterium HSG16]
MKLQEQVKKDLTAAMKAKDEDKKNTLRVLMGEFGRIDAKELTDDQIIKIMKKLIKSERETLKISGLKEETPFIGILEAYLPKMASE